MKDIDGYLSGPVRMASYKMLEFDVIFYGDVAMIPYVADVIYAFPGETVTQKLRVFDVYAKLDGAWNQVGSDTQLHPDSIAASMENLRPMGPNEKSSLLAAREAVWRAWFANDTPQLNELIPPELIAIEAGEKWQTATTNLRERKTSPRGEENSCAWNFLKPKFRLMVARPFSIRNSRLRRKWTESEPRCPDAPRKCLCCATTSG